MSGLLIIRWLCKFLKASYYTVLTLIIMKLLTHNVPCLALFGQRNHLYRKDTTFQTNGSILYPSVSFEHITLIFCVAYFPLPKGKRCPGLQIFL